MNQKQTADCEKTRSQRSITYSIFKAPRLLHVSGAVNKGRSTTTQPKGHLFITVLAYQAVQVLRKQLKDENESGSWWRLLEILTVQRRVTTTFKQRNWSTLHIRKASIVEPTLQELYKKLRILARGVSLYFRQSVKLSDSHLHDDLLGDITAAETINIKKNSKLLHQEG